MGAAAASVAAVGMKAVAAAVPDPIYDMIEAHRKAAAEHIKAVRTQFAFEEAGSIKGERRKGYDHLEAAVDVAWDAMNDAGCDLVNTRPTTLAGILALCRYIDPLFGETDSRELPEYSNTKTPHRPISPKRSLMSSAARSRN
jgi:hypothetical protein